MGLIGRIFVKLGLDNSELKRGVTQSEQKMSGFSNTVKKLGGVMAAAFSVRAVINFAKSSIEAYNQQAIAIAKLEAVLKSTGNAAGLTSKELQGYASELQRSTTFGDETTLDAMARLATFKSITKDIFKDTIRSAQDLATIMGTDLNSAVMQLGKALETPELGLTMLRRSGVSFTDEQIEGVKKLLAEGKKQEAQLIILAEVQSQFGGAAKAAADTAAGAWKQVSNAFGDLKESIGGASEATKGFANNLALALGYVNTIISTENIGWWTKLQALIGNVSGLRRYQEQARKNAEIQEKAAQFAEEQMKGITSVEQAEKRLAVTRKMNTPNYVALTKALQEYIKQNKNVVEVQEGLIPSLEKERSIREEIRKNETDPAKIRALNDEIAAIDERLKKLQMTTEEYNKLNKARTPLGLPPAAPGTIKQPSVVSPRGKDPILDNALIKTRLDENAQAMKDYNAKMEREAQEAQNIAYMFEDAFVNILGNSIEHLTDSLAGTNDLNTGQIAASLLMPLADFAIRAGVIISGAGEAIQKLWYAIANPLTGGIGAVGAGLALIAIGTAAKVGLKAAAAGGNSVSSAPVTSFSGGGGGFQAKPEKVELFATISGNDILLSSIRADVNKKR